jgi:hypothetical protein
MADMDGIDQLLVSLRQSRFRRRFKLGSKEQAILAQRGRAAVSEHARALLCDRLAPATPRHDGKQTPMRGHPVFIAQHATATCCRNCLAKWHALPRGRALTEAELDYLVAVLDRWLAQQPLDRVTPQPGLFEGQ